ncbi:MAG: HD domain-containing protein [Desulfobacterales bacterium]|nr:HD domain-containing protein [Desulfobacterales bacterium]
MNPLANLLFEANLLKRVPRSGFHFLGQGHESVAEHSFMITFIAYTMTQLEPQADALKLISMCLLHDLPEARTGDLNYVHKKYVTADEDKALHHMLENIPFKSDIRELIDEFKQGETVESRLAKDADQLAFILELKAKIDMGIKGPETWVPIVISRLTTDTGKKLADAIMQTRWDDWWQHGYTET